MYYMEEKVEKIKEMKISKEVKRMLRKEKKDERKKTIKLNHDQKLHQVVIHGLAGGIDQEYVRTTDGFFQGDGSLAIGKSLNSALAQGQTQLLTDGHGKLGIGVAGEDLDVFSVSNHQKIPRSLSIFCLKPMLRQS